MTLCVLCYTLLGVYCLPVLGFGNYNYINTYLVLMATVWCLTYTKHVTSHHTTNILNNMKQSISPAIYR